MTVQNKTLIALTISASLLAACNEHNELDQENRHKSDIECVEGDNSRFVNYNTIATVGAATAKSLTRPVLESAPDAPAIPAGAVNMLDIDGKGTQYAAWSAKQGTNYYLPEGAEWTDRIQLGTGMNYFIDGSINIDFYGTKGELNILPNGTLKINGKPSFNDVTIKCWGELDVDPNTQLYIGAYTSFESYSDSHIKAYSIMSQGKFEHNGDITLTNYLDCSGSYGSFTLNGNLDAYKTTISNANTVTITGNCVVKDAVELSNYSSLKVGASLVVESKSGRVYCTNSSVIDVADYLKCSTLFIDSYASIITHSETLVVCDNLKYGNNTAKIHNADSEGTYTVVVVKNLEEAWNSIDRMNGGGIDLHTNSKEYEHLDWTANVTFNGPTYIPEKGLRPEYGIRPVAPAPVYALNHLGSIESIDKDNISATSIDFVNNLVYFSWHKRGDQYDGYIDVADINSRLILSTLHSATQDFNSIGVVGNKIIAVGADAKGAIISNINYSNSSVSADYVHVEGASANSILNVGANKWVTTNSGITILPENKFISLAHAKYAVTVADKVVVLAGTPAASLYVFAQNGELIKNFRCGTIAIENGKNTIFADGDKIYVSLGIAGLRSYDLEGNLLNEFTEVGAGAVNGVSTDENYIYMACGLSGLYILDKKDFSLIKSYTLNGASANFVKKASDGLIYVAYGLNGVHVLELLTEK